MVRPNISRCRILLPSRPDCLLAYATCVPRYPYPIFDLLNTTQRVLLFSFSAVLMTGSTMALKWVYGKLNGIEKMKGNAIHPTKID